MIFPENNSRENGRTIMWVKVDSNGIPDGYGFNLCINPMTRREKQLQTAENWVVDPTNVGTLDTLGKMKDGFYKQFEELTKAGLDTMKGASLMEKMVLGGWNIISLGKTVYIEYFEHKYVL